MYVRRSWDLRVSTGRALGGFVMGTLSVGRRKSPFAAAAAAAAYCLSEVVVIERKRNVHGRTARGRLAGLAALVAKLRLNLGGILWMYVRAEHKRIVIGHLLGGFGTRLRHSWRRDLKVRAV